MRGGTAPPRHTYSGNHSSSKGQGAAYRQNESIRFTVTAAWDCYVQVFFLSSELDTQQNEKLLFILLYPEKEKSFARIRTGQTIVLGKDHKLSVQPPYGNDIVLVIASEDELQIRTSLEKQSISFPLHFNNLLASIYGKKIVDRLSINSSFFVSQLPKADLSE